jgi:ADP-ribose pyrophosphatase
MEKKVCTLGTLFARSYAVDLDEVRKAGGQRTRRLVVRHPAAVVIVPLVSDDEALVVFQHRYAMDLETIEFPAGKLDPGESPEGAAFRELAEETGYRAGELTRLLSYAPAVGYSTEIIHVFVAHGLEPDDTTPDEGEISRVEVIKLSKLKEMILDGEVVDGMTIVALAIYEWMAGGSAPEAESSIG